MLLNQLCLPFEKIILEYCIVVVGGQNKYSRLTNISFSVKAFFIISIIIITIQFVQLMFGNIFGEKFIKNTTQDS